MGNMDVLPADMKENTYVYSGSIHMVTIYTHRLLLEEAELEPMDIALYHQELTNSI